jgi:excinuclease UvrABC nuclease subunit
MTARLEEFFDASLSLGPEVEIKKALAELPARRGLILFADGQPLPIQLLMCADIRRTARARLIRPPGSQSPRKADISSLCKTVYCTPRDSEFACRLLYHRLCHQFFEDRFSELVLLPVPCFVKLDQDAKLPYFSVTENPLSKENVAIFGPFISRKHAVAFAGILNTAFDLCRNPDCLSTGRYESCPYLQMKTCPGPCRDEKMPDSYRHAVEASLAAIMDDAETCICSKENEMRQAAAHLDYEKARRIRDQIEKLKELKKSDYRLIRPLKRFRWLHIDRIAGPRKSLSFCAFLITAEQTLELDSFNLDQTEVFLEKLSTFSVTASKTNPTQMKEHLATVCLFLYRNHRPGVWFDCSGNHYPDTDSLKRLLSETFDNAKKQGSD